MLQEQPDITEDKAEIFFTHLAMASMRAINGDKEDPVDEAILESVKQEEVYKASVIGEFGTSKNEMTQMEQKVFDAMAMASLKTNAPITTHTTLGTYALEQANYLINKGINPQKIIIDHSKHTRECVIKKTY